MSPNDFDRPGWNISPEVREVENDLTELRRELHRRPELGFEEHWTQQKILELLGEWHIEARPMAGTGVVGLIEGKRPGATLLLRADMDALAIQEETDLPWRSDSAGKMHACGHDAHMAMMLTAARLLKKQGLDKGAVKLMFQPAEEGFGGARRMIDEGVLSDPGVDASLAFHVWSGYPVGEVAAISGPVMASVDGFRILVKGKGTHAAVPEGGVDPVHIAAEIITASQSLVTRCTGPTDPVVLSFTSVSAGSSFNVIPDDAEIMGTFRTFDNGVRRELKQRFIRLVETIAAAFGGSAHYESLVEHGPVVNDPSITEIARKAAEGVVGEGRLIVPSPLLVGEDIGEIQEIVPGALILLGCGNPEMEENPPHHNPRFSVDERVLPIGVEIALGFVGSFSSGE